MIGSSLNVEVYFENKPEQSEHKQFVIDLSNKISEKFEVNKLDGESNFFIESEGLILYEELVLLAFENFAVHSRRYGMVLGKELEYKEDKVYFNILYWERANRS